MQIADRCEVNIKNDTIIVTIVCNGEHAKARDKAVEAIIDCLKKKKSLDFPMQEEEYGKLQEIMLKHKYNLHLKYYSADINGTRYSIYNLPINKFKEFYKEMKGGGE